MPCLFHKLEENNMLAFTIANLLLDEISFEVPSELGKWEFVREGNYTEVNFPAQRAGLF